MAHNPLPFPKVSKIVKTYLYGLSTSQITKLLEDYGYEVDEDASYDNDSIATTAAIDGLTTKDIVSIFSAMRNQQFEISEDNNVVPKQLN